MLRWCLPTVHVSGGRGNALLRSFRNSASSPTPSAIEPNRDVRHRGFSDIPSPVTLSGSPVVREQYSNISDTRGRSRETVQPIEQHPFVGNHASEDRAIQASDPTKVYDAEGIVEPLLVATSPSDESLNGVLRDVEAVAFTGEGQEANIALKQLNEYLSSSNTTSATPIFYKPHTIRSLYLSIKHRNQLCELGAEGLSSLISLFGTLSISTSGHSYRSTFMHPLAIPIIEQTPLRSYWPFIVQLAKDKEAIFHRLDVSDHYWLMRAKLAELGSLKAEEQEYDPRRFGRVLNGARFHYAHIRRHSKHPEVHVPYLQTLLANPTYCNINEAAKLLLETLYDQKYWDPRILDILWDLAIQPRPGIAHGLRKKMLHILVHRASHSDKHFTKVNDNDMLKSFIRPESTGYATNLVSLLTKTVSHAHVTPTTSLLQSWCCSAIKSAFPPQALVGLQPAETAWRHLVLLALAKHPSRGLDTRGILDNQAEHANTPALEWEVICLLAVLEGLAHNGYDKAFTEPAAMASMNNILSSLWKRWHPVARTKRKYSPANPTIAASFIHLADFVKDRKLVHECYHFCRALAKELPPGTILHSSSYAPWLVAYMSSILPHSHDTAGVLRESLEWLPNDHARRVVVDGVVSWYKDIDAHLAHEIYREAGHIGIHIMPETLVIWGCQLALDGQLASALTLLDDMQLSGTHQWEILQSILDHVVFTGASHYNELLIDICGAVTRLSPSLPASPGLRRSLRSVLLAIASSADPYHVISMVEAILKADVSALQPSFCRRLLGQLMQRRFFKEAYRFWSRVLQPQSMDNPHTLHKMVLYMLRAGSHRLVRKVIHDVKDRYSIPPSSLRLGCAVQFRWRRPSPVRTLQLLPWLARRNDHSSTELVLGLLLRSGRIRLAKHLFAKSSPFCAQTQRVTMGNNILHATMMSTSRRHAQKLKKTLRVLGELKQLGFEPDRVTVNILVKVLLLWTKDIDADNVRTLFDRMIRSGYPTGPSEHSGNVPFNTTPSATVMKLPTLSSPISFEKHVRPLYKMFIKAFYVREDLFAARTVIGILKTLEAEQHSLRVSGGGQRRGLVSYVQ